MKEFFRNHGVFRSWDDYDNYILAMETVNSEILAFAESFQRKAFEEYKKTFQHDIQAEAQRRRHEIHAR